MVLLFFRNTSFCFRMDVDSTKCQWAKRHHVTSRCESSPETEIATQPLFLQALEDSCVYLCDVIMMPTYSCQCHPHLQLLPWLVLWLLWGFSDPFCLMLAKVPWEKFLHYWTGRVGVASGVLQAWVGLPLGLVQCAWCSRGKNWWTGWINEHSFNVS